MFTTVPLFGPIPGGPEMLIILLVLVLLFGANKIPKLARSTGQALGEFQKGREEINQELEEMKDEEGSSSEQTGEVGADAGVESSTAESESESEPATETASESETQSN